MSLKDELDEKVRQHRLKSTPPQPKEKEKKVQKVKKVKPQASPEKIQKRAMKDALYVWERLRNVFLTNLEVDGPYGITDIKVCFCNDSNDSYAFNRVFATRGASIDCVCICKKRLKYIEETSKLVQEMAQAEGLTIFGITSRARWIDIASPLVLLAYFPHDPKVYGDWISFTYRAPSVEEN